MYLLYNCIELLSLTIIQMYCFWTIFSGVLTNVKIWTKPMASIAKNHPKLQCQ